MFNTILFPTDGSPLSDKAATALAFALEQGKLVAISVVQPFPFSPMADGGIVLDAGLYEQQMQEASQRAIDKIGEAARRRRALRRRGGRLAHAREIVHAANYQCDIILMASHGRKGLNKLFVGSETQKCWRTRTCQSWSCAKRTPPIIHRRRTVPSSAPAPATTPTAPLCFMRPAFSAASAPKPKK
jgi:nucleotide-binding universal stress UspA family protein